MKVPATVVAWIEMPSTARAGEGIRVALHVRNGGPDPVELPLLGRAPTLEVVVADGAGRRVWNLLHGETVQAALSLHPLPAGETLVRGCGFGARGNDGAPLAPGAYTVTAEILAEPAGALRAPPHPLRIVADAAG